MSSRERDPYDTTDWARSGPLARVLAVAQRTTVGVLATGAVLVAISTGTSSAHVATVSQETRAVLTATVPAPTRPGFCPFGTHDGPGSGCRGGSVDEGERWKRAARGTGEMYEDASKCAVEGVGKTLIPERGPARPGERVKPKPKSPAQILWGSQWEAFKCGARDRAIGAVR